MNRWSWAAWLGRFIGLLIHEWVIVQALGVVRPEAGGLEYSVYKAGFSGQ